MTHESAIVCLFVAALASAIAMTDGCRDSEDAAVEVIGRRRIKLPVDDAAVLANAVAKCCDDVCGKLMSSSQNVSVFDELVEYFRNIEFDGQSYLARDAAISDYYKMVSEVADGLLSKVGMPDAVWRFKLEAIDRVNTEIARCEREPKGGIYTTEQLGEGPFMTQRQYQRSLMAKRFDFIRHGFEYGSFTSYFKSLPTPSKKEWISHLEKVAKRKVVIWDPDRQLAAMPVYAPEADDDRIGDANGFTEQIGDKNIRFRRTEGKAQNER